MFQEEHHHTNIDFASIIPTPRLFFEEDVEEEEELSSDDEIENDGILSTGVDETSFFIQFLLNEQQNTTNAYSVMFNMKPAGKGSGKYSPHTPKYIFGLPYKYDIQLRITPPFLSARDKNEFDITLELVCPESNRNLDGIEIDRVSRETYRGGIQEFVYRCWFSVLSFHNGKRPFAIKITITEKKTVERIYTKRTDAFHILARKPEGYSKKRENPDDDYLGRPKMSHTSNK